MRVYALLLYDHLILSEQEGADLCSKVRKSRGVRGITTDEKEITINRSENCEECHGSGAKPGTSPKTCPTCNGSGQVRAQDKLH